MASNEAEVQSVWLTSLITYILLTERELIKKNNIANLVVAKGSKYTAESKNLIITFNIYLNLFLSFLFTYILSLCIS